MKTVKNPRIALDESQFTQGGAADFYDEHSRRFMGLVYHRLAARAAALETASCRVLDVGTGTGMLPLELIKARPDWQITGIDISPDMLKLARVNAAKADVYGKIDYLRASAAELPFTNNSYDIVVSNASLHLWEDPVKVFNEIARVTAVGGYCLIRDNLRVGRLKPFLGLVGWGMGMTATQRGLWMRAVQSAYTAAEARALLQRSGMKYAKVKALYPMMELEIVWRKSQ
jgi:ubiquinone/menaquinone biosynthesis C-methylase UbiE